MDLPEPTIQEEFRRLKVVRCGGKVRHVDVSVVNDFGVVSVLTANNQVSLGLRGKVSPCQADLQPVWITMFLLLGLHSH